MTRETAQELLKNIEVVQAFADQKPIQCRVKGGSWVDLASDDEPYFEDECEWRIKPREPREWFIHTDDDGVPYDFQGQFDMDPNAKIKVIEILTDETP